MLLTTTCFTLFSCDVVSTYVRWELHVLLFTIIVLCTSVLWELHTIVQSRYLCTVGSPL